MKKITPLLLACALVLPSLARAAEFEGTVSMKIVEPRGTTMPMTLKLKSGKARMEFQAEKMTGAMILDHAKQEMIMLMPDQRMYMVHSLANMPGQATAEDPADETKVEKTGETEEILGYDTTKYVTRTKEGTTEVWITDELGTFMGLAPRTPMGPGARTRAAAAQEAWEKHFRGKEAFPLRAITKSNDGKEVVRMEVTNVTKEQLPAALFEPPAGYQKFDMGGMMRGMGMPGMPGKR